MPFTLPQLMPHQVPVVDFIIDTPHAGIWLSLGGGKSLVTLTALARIRPSGHILVIAPINIARITWFKEIAKWGFPLRTRSLIVNERGTKLNKEKRHLRYKEVFTDPPTMYFINVELVEDLVDAMPIKSRAGKREIQWPFTTVIIDESHKFKGRGRGFKALKKVRPAMLRLIQLTGTPMPHSLLDVWAQAYLLDQGAALGTSFTAFCEKYFTPALTNGHVVIKWELKDGAKEQIYAAVNHMVLAAENTSIPMPAVSIDQVPVSLTPALMKIYYKFKKELVLQFATPDPNDPTVITITADNAAILHGKLMQLSSGTMYIGENHDTDYAIVHNEKINITDYLINNNGGSPVLIAYRFKSDKAELLDKLGKLGHTVEVFNGTPGMDARWNAGLIPVMLLQPAGTAEGLNLQDGGHTLIWYTLPDSLGQYQQVNARLARMGQQHPVQIWELVTVGTIDAAQPARLAKKNYNQQDLLNAVMIDAQDVLEDLGSMEDIIGDLDIDPR